MLISWQWCRATPAVLSSSKPAATREHVALFLSAHQRAARLPAFPGTLRTWSSSHVPDEARWCASSRSAMTTWTMCRSHCTASHATRSAMRPISVAVGAAMVGKFTGIAVDEHHLRNVQNGHPITSRVVDLHYPRDELISFNMPRADLVSAVQDASQQACRQVTTMATVKAIVHAKLDDDPRVRRVIDQLEAGSVPALSSEVERLVRECESGFDHASTRLALDGGATEELDARFWAVRGWASRALPYACHPDAVTSALGTLTCARYALGYLPTAFVDEVLSTLSGNTERSG